MYFFVGSVTIISVLKYDEFFVVGSFIFELAIVSETAKFMGYWVFYYFSEILGIPDISILDINYYSSSTTLINSCLPLVALNIDRYLQIISVKELQFKSILGF